MRRAFLFVAERTIRNDPHGYNWNHILTMAKALQIKEDTSDSLPELFGRLADDVTELVDAKITLLKIELREEFEAYLRGTVMILIGGVLALMGFALVNVAVAFLIASLFANTGLSEAAKYGLGFGIAALAYMAIGAVIIVISKNKLAAQRLVPPRTVAELKRDKQRLEEEI
jgi:uncharacterized membrane protein YqjE